MEAEIEESIEVESKNYKDNKFNSFICLKYVF